MVGPCGNEADPPTSRSVESPTRSAHGKMATPLPPLRQGTLPLLAVLVDIIASAALADLVISKAERRVDPTSHIVGVLASLKVYMSHNGCTYFFLDCVYRGCACDGQLAAILNLTVWPFSTCNARDATCSRCRHQPWAIYIVHLVMCLSRVIGFEIQMFANRELRIF